VRLAGFDRAAGRGHSCRDELPARWAAPGAAWRTIFECAVIQCRRAATSPGCRRGKVAGNGPSAHFHGTAFHRMNRSCSAHRPTSGGAVIQEESAENHWPPCLAG
jgi:hypothetical protein